MLLWLGIGFVLVALFFPVFVFEGAVLSIGLTGTRLDAAAFAAATFTLAVWVAARYVAVTRVPKEAYRDEAMQPVADEVADAIDAPRLPVYRLQSREPNAWALPGAVLITTALADQDCRFVRGVLAHEFAHVALGHPQAYGLAAAVLGASSGLAEHLRAAAEMRHAGKAAKGSAPIAAGLLFGLGAAFHDGVGRIGTWLAGPWLRECEHQADRLAAERGFKEELEFALRQYGQPGLVGGPAFARGGVYQAFAAFHPSVRQRLDRLAGVVPRPKPAKPAAAEPDEEFAPERLCEAAVRAVLREVAGVEEARGRWEDGGLVLEVRLAGGLDIRKKTREAELVATRELLDLAHRRVPVKAEAEVVEAAPDADAGEKVDIDVDVEISPQLLAAIAAGAAGKVSGVAAARGLTGADGLEVEITIAPDALSEVRQVALRARRAAVAAVRKAVGRDVPIKVRAVGVAEEDAGAA